MEKQMEYDFLQIKNPLLEWYETNHRELPWRRDTIPYHVWISEIMLQQTRVEAVKDYYHRFLLECPDVEALARISEERLLKLWEGLGYYNRAFNLKKTAERIVKEYQGEFPKEYEQVLALPGIGEYTAGAICSICYDAPTPAVDGNVLRVITRLSNWHAVIDDAKTKKQAKEALRGLYSEGDCGRLTQSLMELGAVICVPNGIPKCELCPLQTACRAYRLKNYMELPHRKEKKKRKQEPVTVFILQDEEWYGIRKRNAKGLLANMWEFPNLPQEMNEKEVMEYLSQQGYKPVCLEKMVRYTHIFSHVEWHMQAYYIQCINRKENLTWVKRSQLEGAIALATAFKVFLEH